MRSLHKFYNLRLFPGVDVVDGSSCLWYIGVKLKMEDKL